MNKKLTMVLLILLIVVPAALAISFYNDLDLKGKDINNVSNAAIVNLTTTKINNTGNITTTCIVFTSGGSICTG